MQNNMTTGGIGRHLIRFSIPLIIGNLFQLTYNAADSIIVGRFAGDAGAACIGTANPLMNIMLFFIVGACNGISVLLAEYYGAGNEERFHTAVVTGLKGGCIFAFCMAVGFALLSRPLLMLIRTPKDILGGASIYLAIISGGLFFNFIYNFYAAALRSTGNATTPLIFLVFSSFVNIAMDCFMVIFLRLGVTGAAVATVISEAASATMCFGYVHFKIPSMRVSLRKDAMDMQLLKKIFHYAWTTGAQKISLNVGKVLVQAIVNPLGIAAIAAFNAVNRVDDFVFQPEQSIGTAMTTFVAQNRGAKQTSRVHDSFRKGMLMEAGYWVIIGTIVRLTAPFLMSLFLSEADGEAASYGIEYLQLMAFFYIMPGMTNGLQGFVRGWGRMKICLIATTIQMAGRVFFSWLLVPHFNIMGVALGCACGWIIMLSYEVPYYIRHLRHATCS